MNIQQYLDTLQRRYATGNAREHAYRADLEALLRHLTPGVEVTNEPANVTDCGNPDFVLTQGPIPVGYIEAKDIGKDLDAKQYREQFDRYRKALDNLVITDYLRFQFFQNGQLTADLRLATLENGKILPDPAAFQRFQDQIHDFATYVGQTIKSPQKLAELMAGKARLLQSTLEAAVQHDEDNHLETSLRSQFAGFRDVLLHDITPREFADLYAQTLAYGLFAARLHDPSLDSFSRQEAAALIPKTNPFLRWLFQYIAGYDIDERIRPTVDNLAEVFRATDVAALLSGFGYATTSSSPVGGGREGADPIIHFYETFLAAYDPALRKSRGVWYTPEPVVGFIVRAVDELLKTEFGLPQGLADTAKTKIKAKSQNEDQRFKSGYKETEREIHRVQILDPATGTGTFLAEVLRHIHRTRFSSMPGAWSGYVERDLIPRLNGFELLMASYAMAHLKLDLLLTETGYSPSPLGRAGVGPQRLRIFLTNSLEEHHPDTGTLFAHTLAQEANEANVLKRDTPVMVVLGNPPYSGESSNKGDWIMRLMDDYKKEPGGGKLQEKNSKWINDDYAKFIRLGQYFVDKNGEGILAYINNHSFLDNPTFRGMRWHLLQSFDTIYIVDLHGNAKKKETAPDGSADQNVFDIQQGVSINIFVKTGKKKKGELARVLHYDLYGKREGKYEFLWNNDLKSIPFVELDLQKPQYFFFRQKDANQKAVYDLGFQVNELFTANSVGIVTARDEFTIHHHPDQVRRTIENFMAMENEQARQHFNLGNDARDWTVQFARDDLKRSGPDFKRITKIAYRPFDERFTYYTGKSKGFHCMPRGDIMQHFLKGENVGLDLCRQLVSSEYSHILITNKIVDDSFVSNKSRERGYVFPLYLYPTTESDGLFAGNRREPNLNAAIVNRIAADLGLRFTPEKGPEADTFAPVDLLDYIYAVLHSPTYRERYREFLKTDFPRVPYPADREQFWKLVTYGGALRAVHLLESPVVEDFSTTYPVTGDNRVEKGYPRFAPSPAGEGRGGAVFINETQYFGGVPESVWNFYIGGYQPAQKWLKDRRERVLAFDDLLHYQRIVAALAATERLMGEIDAIKIV